MNPHVYTVHQLVKTHQNTFWRHLHTPHPLLMSFPAVGVGRGDGAVRWSQSGRLAVVGNEGVAIASVAALLRHNCARSLAAFEARDNDTAGATSDAATAATTAAAAVRVTNTLPSLAAAATLGDDDVLECVPQVATLPDFWYVTAANRPNKQYPVHSTSPNRVSAILQATVDWPQTCCACPCPKPCLRLIHLCCRLVPCWCWLEC